MPTRLPGENLKRPRRRQGCLGCLGSMVGALVAALVLGSVLYLAILAVFARWAFYLGGGFHPLPQWQGWGRLHAKSGDYALFVSIYPWTGKQSFASLGGPSVEGTATLCAPHGQRFQLHLGGGFIHRRIPTDTNGEPMHLSLYHRPFWYDFDPERRPQIELFGDWRNRVLAMDDHGSTASAFLSDGTAYLGPKEHQPPRGERVPITLTADGRSDFEAACLGR